jgi:hypothetical protein
MMDRTPLRFAPVWHKVRSNAGKGSSWRKPLAVGQLLPTLPLGVPGLSPLPIDLEGTYMEARKRGRIG